MAVTQDKLIRPDRVAIYIRWSTEEQSDGTTLIEQREGCEFYVKSQGWFVNPTLTFIDDGYSGASLERPGIRQIRQMVRQGEIDCIVVLKIDRLSRNIVDATQLVLDEWKDKCHLRCVRQPIDTTSETGRMFFSILATFADFERAQITERTYQGRIRRVKEGRAATLVQYGYLATNERGVRVLDPERAPVVAEMFRRVKEERQTAGTIHAWLQEAGIPAPAGEQWSLNQIRRMLKNPIYAGRIVYGAKANIKKPGQKYPHKEKRAEPTVVTEATTVPPIVSSEVFEAVQAILEDRTEYHNKHRRAAEGTHLLSGVARCRCGANINIHWSRGTRYYWCNKHIMHGSGGCELQAGCVLADRIDEAVVQDLLATFGDPKLRSEAVQRVKVSEDTTLGTLVQEEQTLTSEIAKLDKRLNELRLAAGVGDLSLEEWRNLREALEERRKELTSRHSGMLESLKRAQSGATEENLLLDQLGDLDRWNNLSPAQQKDLLRKLVHEIEVYKAKGHNQPYQVKVTWRFAPPA